jgi:hypothetical protein
MIFEIFDGFFDKNKKIQSDKNPSIGAELFHAGGQTDG